MSVSEILNRGAEQERSTEEGVTVTFSAKVSKMLEEIAKKRNIPVTQVIEEALGLKRWYQRTIEEGRTIRVEGKNGEVWELVGD